jgi:DnaA initiator-associating protein
MTVKERLLSSIQESIAAKEKMAKELVDIIEQAALLLIRCLQQGKKILICGNGGSAADAQHFAAELVNRFESNRPPLAALALTTDTSTLTSIGNDFSFDEIFSKQIEALGQPGDVFIAISTSGNSKNILKAMEVAAQKQMKVIVLTGDTGGKMATLLSEQDIAIRAPSSRTARIQECHILCLHLFCEAIDQAISSDANF